MESQGKAQASTWQPQYVPEVTRAGRAAVEQHDTLLKEKERSPSAGKHDGKIFDDDI